MERTHALLAPSASDRWLTCTRSARFEERFNKGTSIYADEGSLAHEIAQIGLLRRLNRISRLEFEKRFSELKENICYQHEMIDYCIQYVDYVMSLYIKLQKENWAEIFIEERVELSSFVIESFGHVDAFILSNGRIDIIDFKYGKGKKVSAVANPQLGLYAYGVYVRFKLLDEFNKVHLHIVQPRIDNIEESKDELQYISNWINGTVKRKSQLAFEGKGDFNPGSHCQFCAGKAKCKALASFNLNVVKQEFDQPDELTKEEIADILLNAQTIINWVTAVKDYALDRALNHKEAWPGHKLVRGKSFRKLQNEESFIKTALQKGYTKKQIGMFKLLPLTQLENAIGKSIFNSEFSQFVIKPKGTPTLVPISDKRKAMGSADEAKDDFKDF
jgi:hypothetical protein